MSASAPVSPHAHILIVDDSPDELRLLVETLRRANYRLSVAFDGAQGYDRAIAGRPDLILMDVRMPRMDGHATCRRLKANPATAHIPVIFLSSAAQADERLAGLHSGGVDYVIKPYSAEEVLARVQIHLALASGTPASQAEREAASLDDDEVLVQATKRYLSNHFADTPALESVARALGTSEKRLSNAFRQSLGVTVFEYFRGERMAYAQRLLATTSLSIVAIADAVGFSSAANFSTAFREYAGMSPSTYRSSKRGQEPVLQDQDDPGAALPGY